MELDRAFARAVELEHARRAIAVVGDFGVGDIVRQDDVVLEAESTACWKNSRSAVAAVGLLG